MGLLPRMLGSGSTLGVELAAQNSPRAERLDEPFVTGAWRRGQDRPGRHVSWEDVGSEGVQETAGAGRPAGHQERNPGQGAGECGPRHLHLPCRVPCGRPWALVVAAAGDTGQQEVGGRGRDAGPLAPQGSRPRLGGKGRSRLLSGSAGSESGDGGQVHRTRCWLQIPEARASGNPTEAEPSPGMQQVAPQAGKPEGNPPGVSGDLRGGNEATGDQGKRQKASTLPWPRARTSSLSHTRCLSVRGRWPEAPSAPAPPPRTGVQGGPGRKPRFSPSTRWPGVRLSRQPEQPVGTLPSRAKPRGLVCRSQSKNSKD